MSIKGLLLSTVDLGFLAFPRTSSELTPCFLSALVLTGRPASRGSRGKAAPVSRGDTADLQVHPHASGRGALQAGPGYDPDLLEESGQHGAEEQEENVHAFTQ